MFVETENSITDNMGDHTTLWKSCGESPFPGGFSAKTANTTVFTRDTHYLQHSLVEIYGFIDRSYGISAPLSDLNSLMLYADDIV